MHDKMTAKDCIFYKTTCIEKKYSNINCAERWIPAKKVPDLNSEVRDLLLEVVDLKQEVPDLRSGVTLQFNPWLLDARWRHKNGKQRCRKERLVV